jgi:hypothetical protein
MIDIGDSLSLDIADGVSLADILNNPDAHHWQIDWEFPSNRNRNSRATPTGHRYGSDGTFEEIYNALGQDFISEYFDDDYFYSEAKEYGDNLLLEMNEHIGLHVNTLKSSAGEVYNMHRNFDINTKRYYNAREAYESYSDKVEALSDELLDMEGELVKTKSGGYDRRYKAYREYAVKSQIFSDMLEEKYRLKARMESEWSRYENSKGRTKQAERNLMEIKEGIYSSVSSEYAQKADEFAEVVRNDIISRGESGVLPTQSFPLAERTLRNRLGAGLSTYPRFWATGQLISSIRIKCTLV